ncbi:MAG: LuxR C-terminal-related transcriptional regulator, partial [Alphaproteobacteria bacterium]|nr:LuxR C-terminal-related transcriptional regulator [Alphaproteobacteria bacterium]
MSATKTREQQTPAPEDAAERLWPIVAQLSQRARLADGVKDLVSAGKIMGLPLAAVLDDISTTEPLHDEDGNRLAEALGWPSEAVDSWVDQNLTLLSPTNFLARQEHLPFYWRTDEGDWSIPFDPEPAQKKVQTYLAGLGIWGGLTAPVHLPRGRIGAVTWLTYEPVDLSGILAACRDPVILIAQYFMAIVRRAREEAPPRAAYIHLTKREVECLTWAALGKTDQDIATILAISAATARFHIENATQKLGANTRTQAA